MDYQALLQMPDYGTNPWAASTDTANAYMQSSGLASQRGMAQGQMNIQNQTNAMQAFAGQGGGPSAYPSFPNAAGLGSQVPFAAPAPAPQAAPVSQPNAEPSGNSRGFNPWSLSGEALSR